MQTLITGCFARSLQRLWKYLTKRYTTRCSGSRDNQKSLRKGLHISPYQIQRERKLCEKYGFIAPVFPTLHPNGVHAGKEASKVDKDLRRRCREYYIAHYGTEEQFRKEFYYVS